MPELPDLSPIVNLVSLVLHTGGLVGRRPVSALLCSPPDSGKTTWVMDRFLSNSTVHRPNMVTRIGLAKWLFQGRHWENCRHIMLPDLNAPMAGSRGTAEALQGFLMALVYEGVTDFHTLHLTSIHVPHPVVVGLVGGLVPSMLQNRQLEWAESGFLRRFLPISYTYSPVQQAAVRSFVLEGRNTRPPQELLNFILWQQPIAARPGLCEPFAPVVESLLTQIKVPPTMLNGNTYAEMYRSLVLAHAMRRGSREAIDEDVVAVLRLSQWINYNLHHVNNIAGLEGFPTILSNGHKLGESQALFESGVNRS